MKLNITIQDKKFRDGEKYIEIVSQWDATHKSQDRKVPETWLYMAQQFIDHPGADVERITKINGKIRTDTLRIYLP